MHSCCIINVFGISVKCKRKGLRDECVHTYGITYEFVYTYGIIYDLVRVGFLTQLSGRFCSASDLR